MKNISFALSSASACACASAIALSLFFPQPFPLNSQPKLDEKTTINYELFPDKSVK
jgi:hypothetical protein